MFSLPPTFGYADPHIRHVHEHNALHYNQKQEKPATVKQQMPSKRTTDPIVTGTSVIGIKYRDGVMLIADTLASYGSMARFFDVQRVVPVGKFTLVGASGDYSDFQAIQKLLDKLVTEDAIEDDGSLLYPHSIQSYMTRVMYGRRNKQDPLYNQLVIGGFRDGKSHLGFTDLRGVTFEGDTIATGYGAHLATPLLRRFWKPNMSFEEAKELVDSCMRVLYYRDARAFNKVHLATVTAEGPKVYDSYELSTDWSSGNIIYKAYMVKNV
jgi:20S proteasome subunit beta 7